MKTIQIVATLLVLGFNTCLAQTNKSSSKDSKTYAEISMKEGGKWEGSKYIGGTFNNIQSLKIAPKQTDHLEIIRYEGPGWESNKIAYRLYLDWRNAIDIFGKKTEAVILPLVGQVGSDSYHNMQDWGCDILNSGKGIGIGSINRYLNNEKLHFREVDSTLAKVENKVSESTVTINYYGWKTASDKIDFASKLSITPDQRYTKHTIQASKEIKGICTGIVKQKNAEFLKKESVNKKWAYIATYGTQSVIPDQLGMAIFYEINTVESIENTELDYLLVFKPTTKLNSYYFLAAWEQEKDGIKSKEAFIKYLDEKLVFLNKKNKL